MNHRHHTSGQSLTEFAVMGSLLILIMLATVDLARAGLAQMTIRSAVAEGAYVIAQDPGNTARAEQRVLLELRQLESPETAEVSFDTTSCAGGRQDTTVSVRYQHRNWFAAVVSAGAITLSSSTTIPQFGSCQ